MNDRYPGTGRREELLDLYRRLNDHFGALHWWPAESPFEVIVGAILTQNTAWTNVERALQQLRVQHLLSVEALSGISEDQLAPIIRSCGYYHLKAARLKAFVRFFIEVYSGNIDTMKAEDLGTLRLKLLDVWGIGPETADSILLYACDKPIFVCDTYTRRIFLRHRLIDPRADYQAIQSLVMSALPNDGSLFNQFHALIVATGKAFCKRKSADCVNCPLAHFSPAERRCSGNEGKLDVA